LRLWPLLLVLLALASPARADDLRPGYLDLTQTDAREWRLVWKAPMRGGVLPSTQPVLPQGCRYTGAPERELAPLALISRWRVDCKSDLGGKRIGLSNFAASQTDVLVRIAPLDRRTLALRLTAAEPVAEIPARADRWQVARTYFTIGVEHILLGFDHLLFVLALVLLLRKGWPVAQAVTAFTVAHSITLAGVTLGFLGLPQRPVEAVIALSIVFLAVEIVKARDGEVRLSQRLPWLVAFLFGLLHGFGFAGALAEIGLPEGETGMALLAFNLGVEAGQLLVVAAALAVLAAIARLARPALAPAIRASAYGIGSLAGFWLIERVVV
jgi:hydrogenase/urease accessory protein HupE